MSKNMDWTATMMAVVEDGQWHDREEVLAAAIEVIPQERALEEIGERSMTMTLEKRARAGARTVALQALQGRRRFGAVEVKKFDDGITYVRRTGSDGRSIGHVAEDLDRLKDEVAALRALVAQMAAHVGFEEQVASGGGNVEELIPAAELAFMLDGIKE